MSALAAIHLFWKMLLRESMDTRVQPGYDITIRYCQCDSSNHLSATPSIAAFSER